MFEHRNKEDKSYIREAKFDSERSSLELRFLDEDTYTQAYGYLKMQPYANTEGRKPIAYHMEVNKADHVITLTQVNFNAIINHLFETRFLNQAQAELLTAQYESFNKENRSAGKCTIL